MLIQISIRRMRYIALLSIVAIGVLGCDKAKEFADNIEGKVAGKTGEKTDPAKPADTAADNTAGSSSSSSTDPVPTVPVPVKKTPEEVIANFLKIESPYMVDENLVTLGALESGLDTITAVSLYRSKVTEKGLAELKKLPNLVVLDASEADKLGGDAAMDIISEMTQLVQVNVAKTGISDAGLAKLAALKQLRALDVSKNPAITGTGMAAFRDIPLVAFYAGETKFGQAGLDHLKSTTALLILGLQNAEVSDANIRTVGLLKGLRKLDLSQNAQITDKGVPSLGGLVNLEELILLGCTIGNEGIQGLKRCNSMQYLCTAQTLVTQGGTELLLRSNPKLISGMRKNLEAEVLRNASTDPNIGHLDLIAAAATNPSATNVAPPMTGPREWTDSTGGFKVVATFLGFEGGKVVIQKEDGTKLELTMVQLSKADQEWVQEELKRRK